MDWDLAIKRNSEALKGIIEALFAMLGLDGEATVSRIPQPLHRAVLRVLRPAESAVRRLIVIAARGLVVKLAPSRPMPEGRKSGRAAGTGSPSFQLFDPRKDFPELRQRRVKVHASIRRASFSSGMIPGWPPCGQRPRPWPIPLRRPMAWSMPNASPAGSRPSSWRSMICRARPGAWPAGGSGGRPPKLRSSSRRSGRALLPATAGSPFTKSMKSSPNATGSPGRR